MHPGKPTGFQRGEELAPELKGFAVTDRSAQHLAGAVEGDPGGHHQRLRDHMRPDADFAEGGVTEHVRKRRVGQAAGTERLDLLIQASADARDLRLRHPRTHTECADEVIDAAGRHTVDVGLHDHRVQRLVDAAPALEQ